MKHLGYDLISHSPWRISERGPWQSKEDPTFWHVDVISGGLRVARVSGVGKEAALANATLIVHSPELLKSIQDIKSINDRTAIENSLVGKHDVKPFAVLINKVTTIAEQVIWKVKGK